MGLSVVDSSGLGVSNVWEHLFVNRSGYVGEKDRRRFFLSILEQNDFWRLFYEKRLKEVEKEPSIIDSYFPDRDRAAESLEAFGETAEGAARFYRNLECVGDQEREILQSIVDSLDQLVALNGELLWYVGVYDGLQAPRASAPCESADDFIRKMRSSIAESAPET